MNDYALGNFKIVYTGVHLADIAEDFKARLKETEGVELEVASSDELCDEGGCEFIIGKSDRDISTTCFDYTTFEHSASNGVFCKDGKVQILGIDRITINESIKYFFDNLLADGAFLKEDGAFCKKIDPREHNIPVKADKSYIRMVTNNILMQRLTDAWGYPVTQNRMSELIGAFALYDADIIALQEVDRLWFERGLVEKMDSLGYSYVITQEDANPVCLFYKTERFSVLEADFIEYDSSNVEGGPYEGRFYTWACLEEKKTGKQIIATSTHFVWTLAGVDTKYTELYRHESARQLAAFSESIKDKYPDAVVMMAGDYNTGLDSVPYRIMSESLLCSRATAEEKVNLQYNTSCSLRKAPDVAEAPSSVIDHVFYSKSGLAVKHYEVVVDKYSYQYSDHVPVIVDFYFN